MKKRQILRIVRYFISRSGYCDHRPLGDCGRCVGRWIREAIRKSETTK